MQQDDPRAVQRGQHAPRNRGFYSFARERYGSKLVELLRSPHYRAERDALDDGALRVEPKHVRGLEPADPKAVRPNDHVTKVDAELQPSRGLPAACRQGHERAAGAGNVQLIRLRFVGYSARRSANAPARHDGAGL